MRLGKGYELWRGPSRLDEKTEIVCIATCVGNMSQNPKTGDMMQVFYMPVDQNPWEAVKTGLDFSVCGNCQHRKLKDGT